MIIGIIGKIGSGKSKCLKLIKELYSDCDIKVYSCDDIAKEILEADDDDDKFTFRYLRPYDFFTNNEVQDDVRKNFHPLVFNKIKDMIDKSDRSTISLIETALPSELFYDICDKVIYIKVSPENAIKRLKSSRSFTDNQFKVIYDSQKFYEKFYERADYVIDNNDDLDSLKSKLKEVMDEVCFICK